MALKTIGNNIYRAKYTADLPGVYLLNVMWAERQVKGCPLKVTVSPTVDASQVICSGEGLKWGILGKDIKSFIDTRKTGPGNRDNRNQQMHPLSIMIKPSNKKNIQMTCR